MFFALPASPVPGLDHFGDDDLPTIPEEVMPNELTSEVHTCACIHRSPKCCRAGSFCQKKILPISPPILIAWQNFLSTKLMLSPLLMITWTLCGNLYCIGKNKFHEMFLQYVGSWAGQNFSLVAIIWYLVDYTCTLLYI